MNHLDAEQTITKYANELLPLFANHWGRWPVEGIAAQISQSLAKKASMWANLGFPDIAQELGYLADYIRFRAGQGDEPQGQHTGLQNLA